MTRTAFPAEILQEEQEQDFLDSVETVEDMDQGDQSEELISEHTLLDTVDVPGLPQQEADRHAAWSKLPQQVRVAVRGLHRQFGHCPRDIMIKLLRAARVNKSHIEAVRLHRCNTCEDNNNRPRSHKTSFPLQCLFGNGFT